MVAEVERDIIKQLGINLSGSLGYGTAVVNFNNYQSVHAAYRPVDERRPSIAAPFKSVTATLQAMEQAGVIRTLAEPTLTAVSGETAHFHGRRRISHPQRLFLLTRSRPARR